MTTEQRRLDLYNGLTEVLGVERADTLMAHLPTHQYDDLATQKDILATQKDILAIQKDVLATKKDVKGLSDRVGALAVEMSNEFKDVNRRIDRLLLTVLAGMFAVVATLVAQGIF